MKDGEISVEKLWGFYDKGVEHHSHNDFYNKEELFNNFYIGNQWEGIEFDEELPSINFIKPICKYKISMIAQNQMAIIFNSLNEDGRCADLCRVLTKFAASQWEKLKMDYFTWQVIKNACVSGDHYLYFFDERTPSDSVAQDLKPHLKMRTVSRTNIHFENEANEDINSQSYVIIVERLTLKQVKESARANKISEDIIAEIKGDNYDKSSGDDNNLSDDDKCTSILYMEKTKGGIKFCRAVKDLIYQPFATINSLDVYPIASFIWEKKRNSSRGVGSVEFLIPNQLEVNKTLARRSIIVKRDAFQKLVYDKDKIQNIEDLDKVGVNVEIENLAENPINNVIGYLKAPPMSGDASILQNEIMELSKNLEGAGDAATGQVDPTRASGEAIKAARDQAAVPLNEQIATYKQFVENIALIWYKLWVAYSPRGLEVNILGEKSIISGEELKELDIDIRIDISPIDPYSILSQEIAVERLFMGKHITFEEYVELLDDSSTVPKGKLQAILNRRKELELSMASVPNMTEAEGMGGLGGSLDIEGMGAMGAVPPMEGMGQEFV